MPESITYTPLKEGLTALNRFLAGATEFSAVPPFSLPVRYKRQKGENLYACEYRNGPLFRLNFRLSEDHLASLSESIFALPHSETTRGLRPYYWLNLHATPDGDLPVLDSCRLRPENKAHKINFKAWHSLEEQLLADYIMGINGIRFVDLLHFDLKVTSLVSLRDYRIAGKTGRSLGIHINGNDINIGDTLRFVPKTDDQKLYEWIDILKSSEQLPEERWPLILSYRILPKEQRIYSLGWYGPERQLLMDRMSDKPEIRFENLRPIRATAVSGTNSVTLFYIKGGLKARFLDLVPKHLAPGEETISIPKTDEYGIYEWLEIYRFDPLTKGSTGEIIDSSRITPEGLSKQDWLGKAEKQLLKDYTKRLVRFDQLKPVELKIGKRTTFIHLWVGEKNNVYLILPRKFKLKAGDVISLVPEEETNDETTFLLTKGEQLLARYKYDFKTMQFHRVEITELNFAEPIDPNEADNYLSKLVYGEDEV